MTERTAPDPRVGEIEARLAKITPGPWERPLNTRYKASVTAEMPKGDPTSRWKGNVDHNGDPERVSIVSCPIWSDGKFFRKQSGRDLDFIAAAPADIAYLLAELRDREGKLARVEGLHKSTPDWDHSTANLCSECHDTYPCPTMAAVAGGGESKTTILRLNDPNAKWEEL